MRVLPTTSPTPSFPTASNQVPFHPTFLRNTWGLRAREGQDPRDPSRLVGVVPMRCVLRLFFAIEWVGVYLGG